MHVTGRTDAGGKFISSKKKSTGKVDPVLLVPIAYNKELAEKATKERRMYREVYIEHVRQINEDGES